MAAWTPQSWWMAETSNLTTILGYLGALAAFLFGLHQYRNSDRWKRRETVLEYVRRFDDTPGARNAMMMLNTPGRQIPLWDKDEPPERRYTFVQTYAVAKALIPDNTGGLAHDYSDPALHAIRDSFEDFLARLKIFATFLKQGLLDRSDIKEVIDPWVRKLGVTGGDDDKLKRNLRIYIAHREYHDVQDLFREFGMNLKRHLEEDRKALADEIERGEWDDPLGVEPPKESARSQDQQGLSRTA